MKSVNSYQRLQKNTKYVEQRDKNKQKTKILFSV